MKLKSCLLGMMLALATVARGATNDLTGLLQQGLFEEEANRDLNAAIANYQSLASAFDKDRQLAATAVFRLGECYRKLGKTNEAAAQYQRILKDFSDQQTLVTLSRQNLAGLNVAPAPATSGANESSLANAQANVAFLQAQLQEVQKMPRAQARIYVEQNFPNPVLTELVRQLDLGQQDLIKLKSDYAPDNPKYKNQEEVVDTLNAKVEAQVDGVIEGLKTKLAVAQSQVDLLRNQPEGRLRASQGDSGLLAEIEQSKARIADYENRRKNLLKTFLPENSQVRDLNKRIDSEKNNLAALTERLQNSQGAAAEEGSLVTDEEQQEIKRIQAMIQNSPDLINAGSGGITPLTTAASRGQLLVAKYLLDHGADVNGGSGPHTAVPLSAAAESGQKAMVELLLSRGADVNGGGLSPLYDAVQKGYMGVAEVLLAHHADVNLPSRTYSGGLRPIQAAARDGRAEMVKLLIQNGADLNVADPRGETALEYAAGNNNTNEVKLLLEAKASVESKDNDGNTALHKAAEGGNMAVVSLLLDSGAHVDPTNNNGDTPLLLAVNQAKVDVTRVLLDHKADPNSMGWLVIGGNRGRYSPAYLALPHPEILKLLLDGGAKPSDLYWAIDQGRVDSVRLLLDHGADPNYAWVDGTRPLVHAINKCKAAVPILLDKGADPNGRNERGTPYLTALFQTADPEIGRWLVEHKADVNAREERGEGKTPLMAHTYDTNFMEFLLGAGAGIDLQDTNGNTALHYAVYRSRPTAVAVLLAHKANPNIQNELGYTPLDLAQSGSSGPIGSGMWAALSTPIYPDAEKEKQNVDLLMQSGGLANLPKRNRIEVRRASTSGVAFTKGSRDWNRYSLLEMIAGEYDLISQKTSGEWQEINGARSSLWQTKFRFPDLKKVVVYRRTNDSPKQTAINVDVEDILGKNDCSRDMWLQWGDVIEIPEADHPVDQRWGGLTAETVSALTNCIARQVTIIVKGVSTHLKIAPELLTLGKVQISAEPEDNIHFVTASFMLRSVLDNSKLVRVSSDLSRVKVTRIDPDTKKKQEWTIDCTKPNEADLWLRDGDVIDVPEK